MGKINLEAEVERGNLDLGEIIKLLLESGKLETRDFLYLCSLEKFRKPHFDLLAAAGVDLRAADEHGRTALFCAAESGNLVLVRTLLEMGLDPGKRDDAGEIPLAVAVRCGNLSVAERLLEKTADPASVVDDEGATLLHKAAWSDLAAFARKLVEEYGMSVDLRDRAGRTPLHVAAYQGSRKMLKFLLDERAADVDAPDGDGRTPLFSGAHSLGAVKFLIEHGANPRVRDKAGSTPLEFALASGDFDTAKYLGRCTGVTVRAEACRKIREKTMRIYMEEIAKIPRTPVMCPGIPLPPDGDR